LRRLNGKWGNDWLVLIMGSDLRRKGRRDRRESGEKEREGGEGGRRVGGRMGGREDGRERGRERGREEGEAERKNEGKKGQDQEIPCSCQFDLHTSKHDSEGIEDLNKGGHILNRDNLIAQQ
jgi:hypothetical protein